MTTESANRLIWTENSVCEVDERAMRIRKSIGLKTPTGRIGTGWKPYLAIWADVGEPASILWRITSEGVYQMTFTSTVVAIEASIS